MSGGTRSYQFTAEWVPILHDIIQKQVPELFEKYDGLSPTPFKHSTLTKPTDWTSIKPQDSILYLIAVLSSRVFHGPTAINNDLWHDMTTSYTTSALAHAAALRPWHPWLRPLIHRFLPSYEELNDQWTEARRIVAYRMTSNAMYRASGTVMNHPPSYLDYLTQGNGKFANTKKARDPTAQTKMQLSIAHAGLQTTSAALTQCLLDLAAHPEYAPALRDEARAVLAANGGALTRNALSELKKMDSFMKESQRLNPNALSTSMLAAAAPHPWPFSSSFLPFSISIPYMTYVWSQERLSAHAADI